MAKKKMITTDDLVDHKTVVPPTGGVVVMDENTQPKDFDWKKMEADQKKRKADVAENKPTTTNK